MKLFISYPNSENLLLIFPLLIKTFLNKSRLQTLKRDTLKRTVSSVQETNNMHTVHKGTVPFIKRSEPDRATGITFQGLYNLLDKCFSSHLHVK